MKSSYLLSLFLIIFLGVILRFYQLGEVPIGFHRDEAFFGYNTYSLLQTGREMSGNFLPLHLQSLLYSPAGYSYVSIPAVIFFGLNEFSVRFTAAFFGSITVPMTYFLVKKLFRVREKAKQQTDNEVIALLSAFFLAISPWHINLSRTSVENVLVVFFIVLGIFFYLLWVRNTKLWFILLSFFCFVITLLIYQAPRAFLPLFIPLLFIFFHPHPWKKKMIKPVIIFLLFIILPITIILSSHDLTQRLRMLSIFQNPATQLILDEQIREDGVNAVLQTRFFHNKIVNYSITFFDNYFSHFSYDFLFLDKGFPDRYRVPQMGLLYFFELPLLLFGIWRLFLWDKKIAAFLSGWVLLAPLGSAFTYDDVPNLQRTLIIFPALSIVVAYGFLQVWEYLSQKHKTKWLRIVLVLIVTYGLLYYLHQYYVHQINHRPWYRQEGYKQLTNEIKKWEQNYKKVIITDEQSDPAIFFLFFNKYEPKIIQNYLIRYPTNEYGIIPIEKYQFVRREGCPLRPLPKSEPLAKETVLSGEKNILYINSGNCKINDQRIQTISQVKRSDGTVVFVLQDVKE